MSAEIEPLWDRRISRTHTLNHTGPVIMVDGPIRQCRLPTVNELWARYAMARRASPLEIQVKSPLLAAEPERRSE